MRSIGNWWGEDMDSARVLWRSGALVLCMLASGCARGELNPEPLAVGREACAFCRMTVSQPEFASQVVAPGELPKFFDDLGCLGNYLTGTKDVPASAAVFVTDHRTKAWVRAEDAVFSRMPSLATPMNSHLVAHASSESREADPIVAGSSAVPLGDVVPPAWQATGRKR